MRLLVAADRDFRRVRVHRSVGELEEHVARALAARVEVIELEARQVGDEVRLPHVDLACVLQPVERAVVAFAVEVLRLAHALGKRAGIVEDEALVVIMIESERQVVRARQPCVFATRRVEDLVLAVERNREQRLRAPFERVLLAVGQPHRGRTIARQRIEERLVQVLHRRGLLAGLHFEHEIGAEVAPAVRVREAAARVVAVPLVGLERQQVMAEVEMHGDALLLDPVHVGIEEDARALGARDLFFRSFRHVLPRVDCWRARPAAA